jgi:hypothetical protein
MAVQVESEGRMVTLNAKGEVADFVNESQFEGGESAYECVAFSAALIKFAGQPGKGPTGTGEQVDQTADFWYGKVEGSYAASNQNGMSLDAEYVMLRGLGMPFRPLSASVAAIKGALLQGYPVMLCGAETGMHDLDLGGAVPYGWTPTGNHCIVACGITSDGNLLVRDTASIASSGVRPGPRRYNASALQIVSATAIIIPWEVEIMVPTGWHDDGTTLVAPNGVHIVQGFRSYVLAHNWDSNNWPIAPEFGAQQLEGVNPQLGGGSCQYFRWIILEYTTARGVFEMWVGGELLWIRNKFAETYKAYQQATKQIQTLQSQIKASSGLDVNVVANRLTAIGVEAQKIVALTTSPPLS